MLSLLEASEWTGMSPESLLARIHASPDGFSPLPDRLREARRKESVPLSGETSRFLSHEDMRRFAPPSRQKKFTIGIQKGGVGKTMIALNLATTWAAAGVRVLFLDLDPQASATNFLLPEETDYNSLLTSLEVCMQPGLSFAEAATPTRFPGLDLIAAKPAIRKVDPILRERGALAFLESRLQDAPYDCILFDVPPSLNELVLGAYCLSDALFMPILPDVWSLESAALTIADIAEETARHSRPMPKIHLIRNRFRPGRIASAEAQEQLDTDFAKALLPHCIPETAAIQNLVNEGNAALYGGNAALRKTFLELSFTLWNQGDSHA